MGAAVSVDVAEPVEEEHVTEALPLSLPSPPPAPAAATDATSAAFLVSQNGFELSEESVQSLEEQLGITQIELVRILGSQAVDPEMDRAMLQSMQEGGKLANAPASSKALSQLPTYTWRHRESTSTGMGEAGLEAGNVEEKRGEHGCSCVICTEDFVGGARVTRMPCGHVFHAGMQLAFARRAVPGPDACMAPKDVSCLGCALPTPVQLAASSSRSKR